MTIENARIEEFEEGVRIGGDAQKDSVRDLVVFGSTADGIDLNDSDGTKITGTLVTANGAAGVQIEGSGNTVKNSDPTVNTEGILVLGNDNTLSGNRVYRCSGEGIRVAAGAVDHGRAGLPRRPPRAQHRAGKPPRRHRHRKCEHDAAQEHRRLEPRARHHRAGGRHRRGGNRASHNPDEDCSPSVRCD